MHIPTEQTRPEFAITRTYYIRCITYTQCRYHGFGSIKHMQCSATQSARWLQVALLPQAVNRASLAWFSWAEARYDALPAARCTSPARPIGEIHSISNSRYPI